MYYSTTGNLILNEEATLMNSKIDDKDRIIVEIADLSTEVNITVKEISYYSNRDHTKLFNANIDKKMKIIDFKHLILKNVPELESIHEFRIREEGHW
jgi:hypothetical protein